MDGGLQPPRLWRPLAGSPGPFTETSTVDESEGSVCVGPILLGGAPAVAVPDIGTPDAVEAVQFVSRHVMVG